MNWSVSVETLEFTINRDVISIDIVFERSIICVPEKNVYVYTPKLWAGFLVLLYMHLRLCDGETFYYIGRYIWGVMTMFLFCPSRTRLLWQHPTARAAGTFRYFLLCVHKTLHALPTRRIVGTKTWIAHKQSLRTHHFNTLKMLRESI